ncbi:Crp/Fnr family transcriptional regulator [Chitinimonas lacunae]|uniref:Crp/Fnr family transcriptional regulator n=1 Tax=Chitinimonas lacunae TaxID=1963018 RepID=A0ABV8MU19_9NEIS
MKNEQLVQRLISCVGLFAGFEKSEAAEFLSCCVVREYPPGTRLFNEGDPGRELFILVSGHVEVSRAGQRLARFGPGDCFGELALLDFGPRSAAVVSEDRVRALVFDRGSIYRVPELETKLYRNLAILLARRLRDTGARLAELAEHEAPPERLDELAAKTQGM